MSKEVGELHPTTTQQDGLAAVYEAAPDPSSKVFQRPLFDVEKMTLSEKADRSKELLRAFAAPTNHRVAIVFILTSVAMFGLPLIVFAISNNYAAENIFGAEDPLIFSGILSLVSVVMIMIFYTIYALREADDGRRQSSVEGSAEKKEK